MIFPNSRGARARWLLKMTVDLLLWSLAAPIALQLRQDGTVARADMDGLLLFLGIGLAIKAAVLMVSGLERRSWTRSSTQELVFPKPHKKPHNWSSRRARRQIETGKPWRRGGSRQALSPLWNLCARAASPGRRELPGFTFARRFPGLASWFHAQLLAALPFRARFQAQDFQAQDPRPRSGLIDASTSCLVALPGCRPGRGGCRATIWTI